MNTKINVAKIVTKSKKIVLIYMSVFALLLFIGPRPTRYPSPEPGLPLRPVTTTLSQPKTTPIVPPRTALTTSQNTPASIQPSIALEAPAGPPPQPVETIDGHPNYPYSALLIPNDPGYNAQWYSDAESAPRAWGLTTGSSQTVVAVIDTGFALNHQDLANRWWTNAGEIGITTSEGPAPNCTSRGLALNKSCNNLDNDGDGYPSDWRGWDFSGSDNDPSAGATDPTNASAFHGTYVSGLAAGTGNNGVGYAGVNWNTRIMPLQALSDSGTGYTNTIAAAVRYAADHGANVINLSLGSTFDDSYLRSQIDYAIAKGITVVAASGNDGCDCMLYPANYSEVVAVGASDRYDNRASFSSYGANLDIVAPGAGGVCAPFYSASNSTTGYSCGGQGTSFAAPQVSGAVALMLAKNPSLSPAAISAGLHAGSDKVRGMNGAIFTTQYGYGRLNLYGNLVQSTTPVQIVATTEKPSTISKSGSDASAVCLGTHNSSCSLRLTGPNNEVITLPAVSLDQFGDATVYFSPLNLGMSLGTWQVDSLNAYGGVISYAHTSLSITP